MKRLLEESVGPQSCGGLSGERGRPKLYGRGRCANKPPSSMIEAMTMGSQPAGSPSRCNSGPLPAKFFRLLPNRQSTGSRPGPVSVRSWDLRRTGAHQSEEPGRGRDKPMRNWTGVRPRYVPTHIILHCKCGAAYQRQFDHRHDIRVRKRCTCGERLLGIKWGKRWEQV
jgi:hypothetical protein